MRALACCFLYVASSFGLWSLYQRALHFRHFELTPPPAALVVMMAGVLAPLVLGFACGMVLRAKRLLEYWPIAVSPFIVLSLRLLLEDATPGWLAQNSFVLLGACLSSAVVALGGARLQSHIESRLASGADPA